MHPICAKIHPLRASGQQKHLCQKWSLILWFCLLRWLMSGYTCTSTFCWHLVDVTEACEFCSAVRGSITYMFMPKWPQITLKITLLIKWAKTSQRVSLCLPCCAAAEDLDNFLNNIFHLKAIIKYSKALEDTHFTEYNLFEQKFTLSKPANSKNLCAEIVTNVYCGFVH